MGSNGKGLCLCVCVSVFVFVFITLPQKILPQHVFVFVALIVVVMCLICAFYGQDMLYAETRFLSLFYEDIALTVSF